MSATGHLLARTGAKWNPLELGGNPKELRQKFKHLSVAKDEHDFDEIQYFDSYGATRRRRFGRPMPMASTTRSKSSKKPLKEKV